MCNETFTTVKITAPQGGNFVADRTQSLDATNRIEWFGNSSGYGYLHAALNVPGTNEWHLIIKGISGKIDYSEFDNIRFSQDAVFADLLADEDFGNGPKMSENSAPHCFKITQNVAFGLTLANLTKPS